MQKMQRFFQKGWLQSGPINQKYFTDLTEEEKAKVTRCDGIKSSHPCKNPVFRCSECGNYGCDQELADKCTKQGFKNDKCLNCGMTGTKIPVMKEDLEKFIAEWEKEVPEVK